MYLWGLPAETVREYGRKFAEMAQEWIYPELKERYYQKLRQIQQEIAFLEGFLDQVEDPQTRDILRLYYVNGLTQEQIAEELGYTRETISRKIRDFWQNSHK